jgi:hypothetical protein
VTAGGGAAAAGGGAAVGGGAAAGGGTTLGGAAAAGGAVLIGAAIGTGVAIVANDPRWLKPPDTPTPLGCRGGDPPGRFRLAKGSDWGVSRVVGAWNDAYRKAENTCRAQIKCPGVCPNGRNCEPFASVTSSDEVPGFISHDVRLFFRCECGCK